MNRRNISYERNESMNRGFYRTTCFFFFTSTCDSRLSDLIVPIAGLSIVWFITKCSGKLHSIMAIWDDRNMDGDEYYGGIKFSKIVQFFFLFFFRLFGTTLE